MKRKVFLQTLIERWPFPILTTILTIARRILGGPVISEGPREFFEELRRGRLLAREVLGRLDDVTLGGIDRILKFPRRTVSGTERLFDVRGKGRIVELVVTADKPGFDFRIEIDGYSDQLSFDEAKAISAYVRYFDALTDPDTGENVVRFTDIGFTSGFTFTIDAREPTSIAGYAKVRLAKEPRRK